MFRTLVSCAALAACLVLVPGCKSDAPPEDLSSVPGAAPDPSGAYALNETGLNGQGICGTAEQGLLPGEENSGKWVDAGKEGGEFRILKDEFTHQVVEQNRRDAFFAEIRIDADAGKPASARGFLVDGAGEADDVTVVYAG